jgi:two-component system sensor histidine kinase CiaH
MIDRLRRKFIFLVMCSLMAVLLVIVGTINLGFYVRMDRHSDAVLDMLNSFGGSFPRPNDPSRFGNHPKGGGISAETPYETRYFTVMLNEEGSLVSVNTGSIAAVSSSEAVSYARQVWESGRSNGYSGDYKYLRSETDTGTMIIFLYMEHELSSFRSFLLSSAAVSLGGFLAVFLLVLIFSKRLVRPVAVSYEKQKRFITDAGHELRTPLTIIDASADVLEMEQGESEWSRSIRNQARRLSALTESLVSLSRMEEAAGQLDMVDFPLSDAVSESAQAFVSLARTRGRNLVLDIEPHLTYHGSETAIRQLVGILADNAVKYAAPDSEILLSLKRQGKSVILQCKNAVESMEKGDLDIFFERFYRADASRSSENGGYGIGLSMARSIVTAHKGKITAKSEDGRSIVITAQL